MVRGDGAVTAKKKNLKRQRQRAPRGVGYPQNSTKLARTTLSRIY